VLQVLERLARQPAVPWETNGHAKATDLGAAIRLELSAWVEEGRLGDCPLPELYRRLPSAPSIGQFHDQLRRLHEVQEIYLHPWTGPLYDLPEPALALLVGHEIAYYASIRS
jgi:hypothetical protein